VDDVDADLPENRGIGQTRARAPCGDSTHERLGAERALAAAEEADQPRQQAVTHRPGMMSPMPARLSRVMCSRRGRTPSWTSHVGLRGDRM
jgi:hypothetical protein